MVSKGTHSDGPAASKESTTDLSEICDKFLTWPRAGGTHSTTQPLAPWGITRSDRFPSHSLRSCSGPAGPLVCLFEVSCRRFEISIRRPVAHSGDAAERNDSGPRADTDDCFAPLMVAPVSCSAGRSAGAQWAADDWGRSSGSGRAEPATFLIAHSIARVVRPPPRGLREPRLCGTPQLVRGSNQRACVPVRP
jgi:hypothetical protein